MTIKSTPHYYVGVKLPQGADAEKFLDHIWNHDVWNSDPFADIDNMSQEKSSNGQMVVYLTPCNDVSLDEAQRLEKLVYEVAAEFGYELEGV